MNLWLDDERPCPYDGWDTARTAQDAVDKVDLYGCPVIASLDHDLVFEHYPGNAEHEDYSEPCGCEVLKWMLAEGYLPETVIIHSMNQIGAAKMIEELQRYGYQWRGMHKTAGANPYSWIMERD